METTVVDSGIQWDLSFGGRCALTAHRSLMFRQDSQGATASSTTLRQSRNNHHVLAILSENPFSCLRVQEGLGVRRA